MNKTHNVGMVVITGAGSGIGLATALHYAGKGWRVGLIGRGRAALDEAARQVRERGGDAHVAVADVADAATLDEAASALEVALGPIDVWVNNAGIGYYGLFSDVPDDAFRRVIDVNLIGTVNGTRSALARMRPRDKGTIVQVLSAIAYRGVPLQSAYSASKYGLRGFTEAVRAELVHERSCVYLTMVHPPAVNTPFYSHAGSVMDAIPRPPPPVYQPEMLGEAIYLAGTTRRREWFVGEQATGIRLGNRLAPQMLDALAGIVGVSAQQTTHPKAAARRNPNTFAAGAETPGMHGPFGNESLPGSLQWSIAKQSLLVRAGLASAGLGLVALGLLKRLGPSG